VAIDILNGIFPVRLFNSHLEVRFPDPNDPFSAFIQSDQAFELIDILDSVDTPPGPIIVVGDINSSPEHEAIGPIVPPYMQLASMNHDAWTLRPGKPKGYTCCYNEDLSIPADLYERIDVIFSSVLPSRVKANVVGNDEADQTASGLWPSDHAGVAARMKF
jgi:hypothetical protein